MLEGFSKLPSGDPLSREKGLRYLRRTMPILLFMQSPALLYK